MNLPRLALRLLLGSRRPITSGELRLVGPASPVTIRRDKWGVPHVDAANETDGAFAVGFCQGQDRAGQLELLWRFARGRLAEWVGPGGVAADRLSRRVGFRRAAEAQLAVLAPDCRAALEAFAAGVNAGTTAGLRAKPHEFALLGGEPSAWDAADPLAVLKVQSFLLPSNWDAELARLRLLAGDGPDAVRDLDPVAGALRSEDSASRLSGAALDALNADLAAVQQFLPAGGGSNNWAVAGSRTGTGKPLLASDPHLPPTAPPPWYLVHVRTPDGSVCGASMVGTPAVPVGHNGFAAWGVTAGLTDNTDLFLETPGPDGRSVKQPDGSFAACDVLREVIRVKGKSDVVEEVLVTPRGPVIAPPTGKEPFAVSLRAVWLDPLPVVGFLRAWKAKSFDEFRRCFEQWPGLPLNVVYADAGGTIGYQLVGQLPVRKGGNGLLPTPADRPGVGWEKELVPFAAMPYEVDPEREYVASANSEPPASGPFLGLDFLDSYRVTVIREAFEEGANWLDPSGDWDVKACQLLQTDTWSIPWREMKDAVLAIPATDSDVALGLSLLREWRGYIEAESPAAAVFELFVAELCVRVAKAKALNAWASAVGEGGLGDRGHNLFAARRVGHLVRLVREQPAGWFARSWPEEMADVLAGVVRKLRREAGPAPAYWAWGHLRPLVLDHPLFGKSKLIGPAFRLGPIPVGGDANTVNQSGCRPANPTARPHIIPGLRAVFDLADVSKSTFVLCGGQSGNPCSRHYADQLPLWRAGEAAALSWEPDDVIRGAKETLRLFPKR
jgi:penicillin amidase